MWQKSSVGHSIECGTQNKLTRAVYLVAEMKIFILLTQKCKNIHLLVSGLLRDWVKRGDRQEKRLGRRGASAT